MNSKVLNIIFSVVVIICMVLIVVFSTNAAKDFVHNSDGRPLSRGAKIASIVVPAVVGFLLIPAIAKNTIDTYRFESE